MPDFGNGHTLDGNPYEGLRALVRLRRGLSGREITGLYLQVKNTCKGEGEYSGWSPQFYGLLGLNWTGNAGRYAIPEGIGYDMNGNIQTMKRNGVEDVQSNVVVWGAMDEMTYHYNGNQLESIEDNVAYMGGVFEQFRKQSPYTGNAEYLYDGNGNIVQDVNKGVEVSYNYLNKPILIDFGGGHRMEYVYTADGRKLRERIKQPGQLEVKGDYPLGGLYYRDNGLVYISTAEGRVLQTSSSIDINTGKVVKDFRYEYYLKDHLGNVRFLFSDIDTDGVPEILQEDAYDPWGVRLAGLSYTQGERNGFLYNGKEQVKGLGWYDYGFRWYMPDVGRFLGADPLAEKFAWLTTYQYGSNNPVLNIDLDGLEGVSSQNTSIMMNSFSKAIEMVRSNSQTSTFFSELSKQSNYDVYFYTFEAKKTYTSGIRDACSIDLNGMAVGWQGNTRVVSSENDLKNTYSTYNIDYSDIEESIKSGKKVITIGLASQLLDHSENVCSDDLLNERTLFCLAYAITHETKGHGLSRLLDKPIDENKEHLNYQGQAGGGSPSPDRVY